MIDSVQNLSAALLTIRRAVFKPLPRLTLPEWADQYRHLSAASGAIGGPWQTSRVEIARGPMMAVTEPGVRAITVMTCTQTLKTSLLENVLGYFAHLDPCPILLTQPKDEAVDAFSKERLAPMITASPALREIFAARVRASDDTLRYKKFPGGFIALASTGSPTNLAMRAIRITLLDEIDKYEVTNEGDPVRLAEERTATFTTSALKIRACSPTWEETSRIYASYRNGDMRRPFARCPHCGTWLALEFFRHVIWERGEGGAHYPDTAAICCDACGAFWTESERLRAMTTKGEIQHRQCKPFVCCGEEQIPMAWEWNGEYQVGYALCDKCHKRAVPNSHASFTASKLFSPFITTIDLARNWIESKDDPELKQTFYNTQLGIPYKAQISKEIASHWLMARREEYPAAVPPGVLALTAGVDVQSGGSANEGRLVAEVVGWGIGEESWSIDVNTISGDVARPELWLALDEYLSRSWGGMYLLGACVDSGGHHTQEVYNFTRTRINRNIWAIKGASERGTVWAPVWPPTQKIEKFRTGYKPIILGVNAAKESVRQRLMIAEPGPGYCHFPADRPQEWFDQLTAENLQVERQHGVTIRRWVAIRGRANEGLDCRVYAYAALQGLYLVRKFKLEKPKVLDNRPRGRQIRRPNW